MHPIMAVLTVPLAFFGLWETTLAVGLGAASIPVIIHLLNRRRYQVVTWAAMRFLINAQKQNTRKMRLEQLILLLVRTLLIILIILAMASVMPWAENVWAYFWPDGAGFVTRRVGRAHKILVIDGSLSMSARKNLEKTPFEKACDKAIAILDESQPGDAFSVLLMKDQPVWVVGEIASDASNVKEEIRSLKQSHGNANVSVMLNMVAAKLAESPSRFPMREVYFLTDMQRSTWLSAEIGRAKDVGGIEERKNQTVLQQIQSRGQTIFVDVGASYTKNLAVTKVQIGGTFIHTGSLLPISATIENYSEKVQQNVKVELLIGRARETNADAPFDFRGVAQELVTIKPAERGVTVNFGHTFTRPGVYAVQVKISGDELAADNQRTIIVTVKESIPVLLVNGKPSIDRFTNATGYLDIALNPLVDAVGPNVSPLRPKVISTSKFADSGESDLTEYDCIFLCDVPQFSLGQVRRLRNHLKRGGGIVISMGQESADNIEVYNRLLYDDREGLLPARLLGLQQAPPKSYFLPMGDTDSYRKPPLQAFAADDDRIALSTVHFRKYVRAKLAPDIRVRTILSLSPEFDPQITEKEMPQLPIGDPLLIEWNPPLPKDKDGLTGRLASDRYRGKVILMTSTWNMDWTSWPGSPSFAPMVHELTRYAVSGRLRENSQIVSEPLEDFLPSRGTELSLKLYTPDDPDRPKALETEGKGDVTTFRWQDTDRSGIYRMNVGQDPADTLYAVNVPTLVPNTKMTESDLTRVEEPRLKTALPGLQYQIVSSLADIEFRLPESVTSEQVRAPMGPGIAHILLIAVLVLLFVEVILAWAFGHFSVVPNSTQPSRESLTFPTTVAVLAGGLLLIFAVILGHNYATGDFLGFMGPTFRSWVESILDIPAPSAGEGTRWALEFPQSLVNAGTDPWLIAGLTLAALALLGFTYSQEGQSISLGYRILCGGLRVFLILLTLLVLIPQIQLTFERRSWPDVVLILDDSLSMGENDNYRDEKIREVVRQMGEQIKTKLEKTLPKRIENLQKKINEKEQSLGKSPSATALAEIEKMRERLESLRTEQTQLGSTNWRPTRLQLAQTLVNNSDQNWPSILLNDRRMKVQIFHLDRNGRAVKLLDEKGRPIDLNDPNKEDSLELANNAIAGLDPQAEESRLGNAVRQVLDYYRGASVSAVIMLTDGVTTRDESLVQVSDYAAQKGVPLFFVGVGDDNELRDLKLHDLQVEDTVYVYDNVIFKARLTGRGYRNSRVPVILKVREKDGSEKELSRTLVQLDPSGKPQPVQLQHQPTEEGEKLYIIEVVPPKDDAELGEVNYTNLRLQRTIFVQESKQIKVLYVEGQPRYEYRFLKNLLERERKEDKKRSVELKVLLLDADADFPRQDVSAISEFPFNKTELYQYDVVILGDVDPQSKKLGDEKLRNLADFVRERGGGLLMIGGGFYSPHAYKNTPLADVLPIDMDATAPVEPPVRTKGFRLELTPVGRLHPIFRFSPNDTENLEILSKLAPMYWWAESFRLKPAAEVLAVHPTARGSTDRPDDDSRLPLAVQQFVGSGRSVFFGFDESWRWRFREGEINYNKFWIQTVRYLSRNRASRTDLRLDRQTPYRQGDPIKVTVRFPDNAPLPGQTDQIKAGMKPDVKVIVEYRAPGKEDKDADVEVQTLKLAKVEGSWATYEGLLTRTREGKYRFWLSSPDVSEQQPNKEKPSAEAVVVLPPGELDRLRMDREGMTKAADISQGRFYTLADATSLPQDIPAGYRAVLNTPGPPRLLWNQPLLFLVILGLFTSEWILRKRKHLL